MKIFKNGNVQMTGLKTIEQGKYAMAYIVQHIKNSPLDITDNRHLLAPANYSIRLINSDFVIGFEVKRDRLHVIMQEQYDVFCTYEPCIYPGVKIQYEITRNGKPGTNDSLVDSVPCRITIAVFQSGCIIITGAKSYQHIESAYTFICDVLSKHMEGIKKTPLPMALNALPKLSSSQSVFNSLGTPTPCT
jgi:TATA-box binding protein (TBP) (component of TFIID and TFIIIB)